MLGIILGMVVLFVLLPLSLYIPFVQDIACRFVVSMLNDSESDYEYRVGSVRIGFPLRLKVHDVDMLRRSDGHTFLHVGLLQTGIDDLPISQPYLILNKVHVEDVQLGMDSLTSSFSLSGSLQSLDAVRLEYDPSSNRVRLREAILQQPDVQILMAPSEPDSIDEPSSPWYVNVDRLALSNGHLGFFRSPVSLDHAYAMSQGLARADSSFSASCFDYNAFSLDGLNLEADSLHYDPQLIHCRVNQFAARDTRSQLEVEHLGVGFTMEDLQYISVRDLDLGLSPSDYLRGDCQLDLALFDSIPSGAAQTQLAARLDSANLIRLAAPYLPSLLSHWPGTSTTVELNARVTPDSLDVPRLTLSIPGHADLIAEGMGQHIFDNDLRRAAFTLKGSLPASDFLLSTLIDEPSQRSYRLPDGLTVDAEVSQMGQRYSGRIDLQQAQRDVLRAEGNFDQQTEAYHLTARTQGLCVSDFMPSLIADRMTARIHADGRHFRFPGRNTRLQAEVQIDTLFYACPDGSLDSLFALSAQASLLQGHYVATLQSEHPYLAADSHLEGTFLPDSMSAQGYFNIPQAYLSRLPYGLAQSGLGNVGFSSQVRAFYNGDDVAQIHLVLDSLAYTDDYTHEHFDDINIYIESEPGILDAELSGGDASVVISSNCGLRDLPVVVDSLLLEINSQRQAMRLDVNAIQRRLPQMSVDFHMAQNNPFYQAFEYHTGYSFQSLDIRGLNAYRLSMEGQIVNLSDANGTLDFDTISIDVSPDHGNYHYALHAMHIDPRASQSYDVHTQGTLMPDSITMGLTYVDGNYLTLYDLFASVAIADDSLTLHLEQDPTIYEQPFRVNPDNYFSLMNYRNLEERRVHTRGRIKLEGPHDLGVNLYSRGNPAVESGNQLLLSVRNLDLAYATKVMQWEGDAGGRCNLSCAVDLFPDSLHARLRSGIRNFHLGNYCADTLAFVGFSDWGHDLRDYQGILSVDSIVKLDFNAHLADSIRVAARIQEFPLPLANTFLPNYTELFGQTTGYLDILGRDLDHARIDAKLSMQEAGINYHDLDARICFSPDTLRLVNRKLQFSDFKLTAANQHPALLRGSVDFSQQLSNPRINLSVSGNNVCLIDNDRLRLPDQYVYGRLLLSPNIKVRGTLSRLQVSGTLNVLSGTSLQYFMSDDPLQSSSRVDQLVEFVNFRQIDRMMAQSQGKRRPPMQDAAEEGLDMGINIEIPSDVKVSAHLAGTDNNRVDIVGGGSLSMQTDNQGNILMYGTYDITSGKVDYKLPILPMVKTFRISNDSQFSWSGDDPGDPDIHLIASEEVRTTVNDDYGSRIVKFLVTININGTLDALSMTFDCAAPEDAVISSDLATLDTEERSKTAMMLLVTQTYIGPGSTSAVGLGSANAALNSMLNREMESMLGGMKGLQNTNIDLGIDTYSADGGAARTNYTVKVSQNLFNDRFRATIGGQISTSSDVGQQGARLGDMSLEWLIKRDGSHYLKLFRRTNYESLLEGELIETGVSYIQERSGYRFRQLLLPTSKKRQERMQQLIQELLEKEEEDSLAAPLPPSVPPKGEDRSLAP